MDQPLKLLLDYEEAAAALAMTRAALRDLVYSGRGPAVTKIGRRIFFAIRDLEDFVDRHRECAPPLDDPDPPVMKRRRGRPTIAEQMARNAALRTG